MPLIVSGYRHLPEGPVLRLDDLTSGGSRRSSRPVREQPLTLTWTPDRHCTGYRELNTGVAEPCPTQSKVTGKLPTCGSCDQRTGFNPSFYNLDRSLLSAQQARYNRKRHVVYLAAFSHDTAKVGISTEQRVLHRLREQGARRALVIARCDDAYEAREHEEAIHRELYLPEQIRGARKLALLSERFDAVAAEAYLRDLRSRAVRQLGLPELAEPVLEFEADYLGTHRLEPPLVDLSEANPQTISGIGVGMVGDILIVREDDRQLALSLKPLIGNVVEISEHVQPNAVRPALQMGFGF